VGHIQAPVKLFGLKLLHEFVVVENLVASVSLGIDFLQENALVLDFTQSPVIVRHSKPDPLSQLQTSRASNQVLPIYKDEQKKQARTCAIAALGPPGTDVVDEYAVPSYHEPSSIELPECPESHFECVIEGYRICSVRHQGVTEATYHFIPTTCNPVKVLPGIFQLIIDKK